MALVRAERVLETSTTTGTGSLTLGGPVTGYRSFASVMSTSDTCYYAIVAVDSSGRPTGAWETGLGTLAAATTLARTTVLASSNGGALVNLTSGTKQVFLTLTSTEIVNIIADIASKASATKVDVYSSNDTWTRPDGAKFVDVICVSGGGGGQSGALAASSTLSAVDAAGGLSGNIASIRALYFIPADALTPTVSITVGAGGAGGASRTTIGANNPGSSGGSSIFGAYLSSQTSNNDSLVSTTGGSVVDGIANNAAQGSTPTNARPIPMVSYAANTTTVTYTSAANAATNGTAGTSASTNNATATGTNGGNGTTLTGASAGQISSGGGGGGGAGVINAGAATACIGGDGGDGGFPGGQGGGGGGAAAQRSSLPTGSRSGKGGNGGGGAVIVITRF